MSTPNKTERSKSERLEARVSKEQKELFQRAADLQGLTLTDFMISSMHSAAVCAVSNHEIMSLLNPPEPNERLRVAAERYKQATGAGDNT